MTSLVVAVGYPANDLSGGSFREAGRTTVARLSRGVSSIVVLCVLAAAVWAASAPSRAALHKPTYAAGDQWVYVLHASLGTFPGFNASQGTFQFGLVGFVYVNVIGPANVLAGNASIPAIRVDGRVTGYLNGTFSVPGGGGTALAQGSFTPSSTEFWEDQASPPIESRGPFSYHADVTFGFIPPPLTAAPPLNATPSGATVPPF